MKFRISGKDLLIFGIFSLLLLYLCAIATSNIHSFSATGSFSGLNPIPGLTKFLGATLLLFIVFLIIIITSVSSLIFERKKGFGLEIGEKENKGYSRWAKDNEIKLDKDVEEVEPTSEESDAAGVPLVNDGKKLWVDNGEYHNLVIGATGSGKSQTVVEPMVELLIKKGESMIITDPKGELYKAASSYMRERGYNVIVLNFRDPQQGNAWNPLTLPYHYFRDNLKDKATELLDDVALNILYDPNNKGEPFWEKSAADYFSGLALGLFEDAKEEEINLNSINFMSTVGEDKFAASNFIKEYFTMKGESSNAYVFASNTINSPTETKGGILSVFRQKIRLFASRENLSEMLSYSDFDMRDIGKQKTAVFIVIQDEKTTYHSLATIFIKQCYETLIDVAQANGGKLPYRTNFILDEFANMPPLKDVTTMVTAARSRLIRFTFIIQNFAQLKSVYGDNDAETIKGNCGNLVYLISTELAALEEISKMCGEVKSSDKDKTVSTPLVTVTDLQKLKLFEAIIIRWRKPPFKTKYTPNFKMNWGHEHIEATFPERKMKEISLFDVKTYVKDKKRENMLNSLGDGGKSPFGNSSNPFMPMNSGSNPFGPMNNNSNPFGPMNSGMFGGGQFNQPRQNPFDRMNSNQSSPFGGPNINQSSPFGGPNSNQNNSFGGPNNNQNGLFGGFPGGLDLDAMMKDIDRKIAELDAEEARAKADLEKKKNQELAEAKKIENDNSNKTVNEVEHDSSNKPTSEVKNDSLNKPTDEIEHDILREDVSQDKKISVNKDNITIATSRPAPDEDLDFEPLPKAINASVIEPNYKEDKIIKAKDNFNIYEENSSNELKMDNKIKDADFSDKNDVHINVNPDNIKTQNSVISDDEFFDDFFSDDE